MKATHVHPKLRIKNPKLLVIIKMQRKFHFRAKDNDRDSRSTRVKRGKKLSRKSVGSTFSCILGKKKKNERHCDGKECPIVGRASSNELENNTGYRGERTLSQLFTFEEPDPTGQGKGKAKGKDSQRVKMNLPLLSFLHKKKGWNNVVTRFRQVRRKASLRGLVRIPSKKLVIRLKLKMIRPLVKKKTTKQFEEGAEDGENGDQDEDRELCKKRILMGGRCRPLSSPATLNYDTNGHFLTREPRHP